MWILTFDLGAEYVIGEIVFVTGGWTFEGLYTVHFLNYANEVTWTSDTLDFATGTVTGWAGGGNLVTIVPATQQTVENDIETLFPRVTALETVNAGLDGTSNSGTGDNNETFQASVDALDSRVDYNNTAIIGLDDRIRNIQASVNGLGADISVKADVETLEATYEAMGIDIQTLQAQVDGLGGAVELGIVDSTSFVVTDSSLWHANSSTFQPSNLFDGNASTVTALFLDVANSTGSAFMEFDAGAVVAVRGFRMVPLGGWMHRFPWDTRILAATSSSGLWTPSGTLQLEESPPNTDEIDTTFPSVSSWYFRMEYTNVARDPYAQFNTLALLTSDGGGATTSPALQAQVDDNITAITSLRADVDGLDSSGTADLAPLQAQVDALDSRVGDNSTAITNLSTNLGGQIQTLQANVDEKATQVEVDALKAQLESLEVDGVASEPSEPFHIDGARFLGQATSDSGRGANNLFDNYMNPYNVGQGGSSLWNTTNVQKPFVSLKNHSFSSTQANQSEL